MEKLKLGTYFIMIMAGYILVLGFLMIFATELLFTADFNWYTDTEYVNYYLSQQTFAEIFIVQKKIMGFMLFCVGFLILIIAILNYRNGIKWSWYLILISGCLVWGTFLGYPILIGYFGVDVILFIIGAALLILGLFIPFKSFFKKK
ncbi:MAG: hypothetical protein P8Y23_13070 [Candidatus Lokiarchaeota archaeon]|jgi:hypothetical protein